MRPGSQGKLLGTCLLEGVFPVVFVKHLFLGDLFLLFPFFLFLSLVVSVVCFLCEISVGSPFSFVVYICSVITVVCFGSWVLVVLY